jgi:hypothetical protein
MKVPGNGVAGLHKSKRPPSPEFRELAVHQCLQPDNCIGVFEYFREPLVELVFGGCFEVNAIHAVVKSFTY